MEEGRATRRHPPRRSRLQTISSSARGSEVRQRQKHGVWSWYREVKAEAEAEARYNKKPMKTPVVALDEIRAKGSIICIHSDDLEEFCKNFLATRQSSRRKSA